MSEIRRPAGWYRARVRVIIVSHMTFRGSWAVRYLHGDQAPQFSALAGESGYQTDEGRQSVLWPGFTFSYWFRTRRPDFGHYTTRER